MMNVNILNELITCTVTRLYRLVFKEVKTAVLLLVVLGTAMKSSAQVTFLGEQKISDKGLFFDGVDVGPNAGVPNNGPAYDFAFGNRITPHGDCIKEYNGYVFLTWYRGGKYDRHVMLSRYNTTTGVLKTIEFGHQHNGFQNVPHIGESHNTIAIGICPIDGTIHMLYDMHSYSENRPSNGSLANDYFRYSYSKKNAATVPDDQFDINQFVKDTDGDYKHLKMRNGTNYKSLTYPNFFLNEQGELFMWIREGGNTNGAYKFCKYNGTSWSEFTQFNVLNAKNHAGVNDNWGLYGDIKFESGKMRIGFARRSNNKNDAFQLNNGFYYGYSDDPNGLTNWKDHHGNGFTLPLYNSEILKVSEPTDVLGLSGENSIYMSSGCDWTVTERGDIHSVTTVGSGSNKKNVHTYRKAGESNFNTSTSFPGGNLYTYKNEVFLIGLANGRVFVQKANGGTNQWTKIYESTGGKTFRHGNVYIAEDGILYFFLMEKKSGSAQPIYLQWFDLGLDNEVGNQLPEVAVTAPLDGQEFVLGDEIGLSATAVDSDGSIVKVNFKINNDFYRLVGNAPYETTFTPEDTGLYKIAARAFDDENAQTEGFVMIKVRAPNEAPLVEITSPIDGDLFYVGETIDLKANATDDMGVDKVNFKINNSYYAQDITADGIEYTATFIPDIEGTYVIGARAFDADGESTEVTVNIEVSVLTNMSSSLSKDGLQVHPNPTSGMTYFPSPQKWTLFTSQGEKIKNGNSTLIDLTPLNSGVYMIKTDGTVIRVIKN